MRRRRGGGSSRRKALSPSCIPQPALVWAVHVNATVLMRSDPWVFLCSGRWSNARCGDGGRVADLHLRRWATAWKRSARGSASRSGVTCCIIVINIVPPRTWKGVAEAANAHSLYVYTYTRQTAVNHTYCASGPQPRSSPRTAAIRLPSSSALPVPYGRL